MFQGDAWKCTRMDPTHPSTALRVEGDHASTFIYLLMSHVPRTDGCRVRKKGAHFKQLRERSPSTTAQERLMVVAMSHNDDDYEVWTHRNAAHAYRKRRGHTAVTPLHHTFDGTYHTNVWWVSVDTH